MKSIDLIIVALVTMVHKTFPFPSSLRAIKAPKIVLGGNKVAGLG